MKNIQVKLIDSSYSVDDAREVLYSLISDKISFINQKILSMHETCPDTTIHLEKRVKELRAEKAKLIATLDEFKDGNCKVEIDCTVKASIHIPELAG